MKKLLFGVAAVAIPFMLASPAMAGCSACAVQTKVPAPEAGKFIYKVTCIDDQSGDEVTSTVTAANDDEAFKLGKEKCVP